MIGFIYKTTCLVNGKIYIGKQEGEKMIIILVAENYFKRLLRNTAKKILSVKFLDVAKRFMSYGFGNMFT